MSLLETLVKDQEGKIIIMFKVGPMYVAELGTIRHVPTEHHWRAEKTARGGTLEEAISGLYAEVFAEKTGKE